MNTVEFLAQLSERGIKLWVEQERLRFRAPQHALTDSLRAEIAQRREDILRFLHQSQERTRALEITIPTTPRDRPLPLSFAQERLWFLDRWQPGSRTYHVPLLVRLRGQLDRAALHQSIAEIVQRHESLRTTFDMLQGQPVQVIHADPPLEIDHQDLRALPAAVREVAATRLIDEQVRQPFDLQRGPLLRVLLVQLDDAEHLLLLVMHHIITDGWSLHILTREVAEFYRAAVSRTVPNVKPLPVQYADVAVWQRQRLQGPTLERYLAYWRSQLQGAPPLINLPTDRPRPPLQTFHGAQQPFELSRPLTDALKALSQREDATLFMTLLTALSCLLGRYTGQTDLIVGTPIANRTHDAFKDLIGFFVNMLVLRVDLSDNPRGLDLLLQVRTVCLQAYAHQDLPFEQLIEMLQVERNLSYQPLVQVVLVLQNTPSATAAASDLTLSAVPVKNDSAKFDLTLTLTEAADRLLGSVEYNVDLFEAATIGRFIQHFQTLLAALAADPTQRVADLALLSASDKQAVIERWNRQHQRFPVTQSLHQRFEQHACATPDAIAVVYEDARISYGELNARANQLAHYLQALGVGRHPRREPLVGFYLDRSIEMIVAVLGILKAGGAYLPLDPAYPAERVGFILADSQVQLLLSQQHHAAQLPDEQVQIVYLDADWPQIATYPAQNPHLPVLPAQLAYVIYTSGSTGQPKGALLTHAHVARLFAATDHWFSFDPGDVWTLFHSIAFDFSVWELWGALLYGGRLVVVPYLTSRAPEEVAALLRREQVTVLNQTPSAFRQLIPADMALPATLPPSALRLVIFGGEALDPASLRPWFERYGDQQPQLVNMYGITETTVHVTYRPLVLADTTSTPRSLIGQPIPDLRLYLLDANGDPVPPGLPGELYVGGAGVARGYGGRPALTATRFVPDPLSGERGARLYRSGDLGRETFDGDIEYLGRLDQQVKLRGFRIEPGEISAALQQHPALREAAVVLHEDRSGPPRLVAYVVAVDTPPTTGELRTFLSQRLPEYMIPAAFMPLAALPLTPHGKLDRRALPAPDTSRRTLDTQPVPPATPVQRQLATIWQRVLKLEQVGIHDSFFALGGDSIRSIQVVTLARQAGLELALQDLFRHQTIAELAQHAQPASPAGADPQPVAPFALVDPADRARLPADVEDAYPLTMLQRGMLFHSTADQRSGVYHDVISVQLRGRLDLALLRIALDQLAAQHPILRTSFDLVRYGEPLQLVHRSATIALAVADLSDRSPEQATTAIRDWIALERIVPFAWDQPPLLRVQVHHRGDETTQFSVSFHHAILDGWSLASLLTELFQRYVRLAFNPAAPLLPHAERVAFRDYVALEIAALASAEHRAFWLELLHERSTIRLPRLRPPLAGDQPPPELVVRHVAIPASVSDGLHRLTRQARAPIKSVLLAAHLRVLATLGNTRDVLTGLVAHGRPQAANSERILGLFLNTLPFRLALFGGSWIELVQATFAAERVMQPFVHYPMARVQQLVGGPPLFEITFNFTNFHVYQQVDAIPEIQVVDMIAFERTNFSLGVSFSLDLGSNAVTLQLQCDPAVLDGEQIERIAGYYQRVLAAMATTPDQPYTTFSPLSEHEYQQLIVAWNPPESPAIDADQPYIHQAFAAQACRTPQQLAVVSDQGQLSYAELDRRANQLAHYLRAQSVDGNPQREVRVGICIERSPWLIVALLAVLKAGWAYVPLDPAYPAERLQFMLADSEAALLLTEQHLLRRLPTATPVVCLEQLADLLPPQPSTCPDVPLAPEQLAYLIYTSGSTGRPKGTLLPHRGLHNLAAAQIATFGITPQSRVLQFASFSFDAAISEICMALLAGATLVLARAEQLLPGPPLTTLLRERAITAVTLSPSVLAAQPDTDFPALTTLIAAGEACPAAQVRRWIAGRTFFNAYGPTESTVCATIAAVHDDGHAPPIGRPIAQTKVYVLDTQMQPVPLGVAGELYIGGIGLARGYHRQPALTAERFVPHPFSAQPGARLYRTGDLVRYQPDGNLLYLGRIDQQVKLRGVRIELGEIEAVLRCQHGVLDAAVLLREDRPGDRRLVAYVVGRKDHGSAGAGQGSGSGGEAVEDAAGAAITPSLDPAMLRALLQTQLPEQMIPAAFVVLDELPRTPNGKLNRQALPRPERERQPRAPIAAPRDALEAQLARIWEAVLDVRPVGIDDDFFALGGHSLTAMRLMAQIEQQIGAALPLATLLQRPTVAGIARAIRQHQPMPASPSLVPIQPGGARLPLFCVHPAGGDVLCYQALARQLGPDQPFYGLQAAGLHGEQAPDRTIETMTARYLDAIQEQQPAGPYYLAGWSVGGIVAFEMARQLQARGQVIGALVLFDSHLARPAEPAVEDELPLLRAFLAQLEPGASDLAVLRDELGAHSAEEPLAYVLSQFQQRDRSALNPSLVKLFTRFEVFKAHVQARQRYQPGRFDRHLCLIQARDQPGGAAAAAEWRALVGSLAVHTVAGSHLTMLREPQVAETAALVAQYLASAAAARATSSEG